MSLVEGSINTHWWNWAVWFF